METSGLSELIFMEVMGMMNLNEDSSQPKIINNYNEYNLKFLELEEDYKDDKEFLKVILDCHKKLYNLYNTIILKYIEKFRSENFANNSMDFIILNKSQEEIFMKLENFAKKYGLPDSLRNDLFEKIKFLAERLDKRFCFDDIALINLIEASSGKNIAEEQGRLNGNQILSQNNGQYEFIRSNDKKIYTVNGEKILDSRSPVDKPAEEIFLKSFPGGNEINNFSRDKAMKKVMENLFDNLNLCIETYSSMYSSGKNTIRNTAKFTDGRQLEFQYIINERNIPHLLGVLKADSISNESIRFLNTISNNFPCELTNLSSAYDVLRVLINNQKSIIASGGLYTGSDGKLYEIIPWEKMILKTSAFMRGDFFKTCFCLAKLRDNKFLSSSKEMGGYVTIASTDYKKGLDTTKSNLGVLNDLLNFRKRNRDYIFRGFTVAKDRYGNDMRDRNGNNIYVPYSIVPGKAETVYVGRNNELLQSLQKYRDMFSSTDDGANYSQADIISSSNRPPFGGGGPGNDGSGGNNSGGGGPRFDSWGYDEETISSIVEEIENEKFLKTFSPEEIALLGLDISRDLGFAPHISKEALDIVQAVHSYDNNAVTSEELENLEKSNGKKK